MRYLPAAAFILALSGCVYFDGDDEGGDDDSGSGAFCGGFAGQPCEGDEYCDYDDQLCGIADGGGTCRTRPTVCPEIYAPVRGSDGQTYSNACEAHGNGADDCGPP